MREIHAYKIRNNNLPHATQKMNYSGSGFDSRVINIIIGDSESILIVSIEGSYPFITNQWKSFIEELV
jgi:hypothetical protein